MRPALLGLLLAAGAARAERGAWGLEAGLAASMGVSRFAGEPSPLPPPADPNNLFAMVPPSASGAQGTGLSGAGGLSLNLTHRRRFNLSLDVSMAGQSLGFDELITFPGGTGLRRSTV